MTTTTRPTAPSRAAVGAFAWFELRTTDLAAAEAFYPAVTGWTVERAGDRVTFVAGGQPAAALAPLPERARALGAPPSWLGHVRVTDVDAAVERFTAAGGQVLGPVDRGGDGAVALVRDAQGAVLAVSSRPRIAADSAVAWHELHTTDRELAWSTYAPLLGWTATEVLDLAPPLGPYQQFVWQGAERNVGAMANTARLPQVHTHWAFYLTVDGLDARVETVRALGGTARPPMMVAGGNRVSYCEDGQGAAFGLWEPTVAG